MKKLLISAGFFWLLLLAYSIFSYSQTDPNLVLMQNSFYLCFQSAVWQWAQNRAVMVLIYKIIVALLFCTYMVLAYLTKRFDNLIHQFFNQYGIKRIMLVLLLIISPLFFSYNALSHDVFNYMFNAKMILKYRANPHQQVALDYPDDDWVRFMHNTHTPAPYAYGWTVFSIIPYLLGANRFITTWLMFRIAAIFSLLLLVKVMIDFYEKQKVPINWTRIVLVALNPLLLIEVVSNLHNDLWMMVPAMFGLLWLAYPSRRAGTQIWAWLMLVFSISTKYATVVLLPFYLLLSSLSKLLLLNNKKFLWISKLTVGWIISWTALVGSMLLFLILLLPRSQQFHPWYLVWILVWLPWFPDLTNSFMHKLPLISIISDRYHQLVNFWMQTIIIFSLTSLWRYVPWLSTGGFSESIIAQQKLITWSAVLFSLTYSMILRFWPKLDWRRS